MPFNDQYPELDAEIFSIGCQVFLTSLQSLIRYGLVDSASVQHEDHSRIRFKLAALSRAATFNGFRSITIENKLAAGRKCPDSQINRNGLIFRNMKLSPRNARVSFCNMSQWCLVWFLQNYFYREFVRTSDYNRLYQPNSGHSLISCPASFNDFVLTV